MEFLTSAFVKIKELFSTLQDEEEALIINNLNNKFDEIIFLLCKSVLIGEQISENDKCRNINFQIKQEISNEESATDELTGEVPELILNIRESLKFVVDFYEFNLAVSKELLLTESNESLFYNFDSSTNPATEFGDSTIKHNTDLFFYCLHTFNIESHFSEENETAQFLQSTKSAINNIPLNGDLNKIKQILIEKIEFLIAKWIFRKKETEPKLFFNENGVKTDLEVTRTFNQTLDKWLQYSTFHYQFDNHWKSEITSNAKIIINENERSLFHIHTLIKYYKDLNPNLEKLKEIYKGLCLKVNENKFGNNHFNKYAYSIASIYALNNYFSLYSEKCSSIDKLKKKYESLKKEKDNFDINNFFLEYKLLFHSFRIINLQLLKEPSLQELNILKEVFDKYISKIYKNYKIRINWSNNHTNYIFQLPINESTVDFSGIEVFFMSSFVLPVPLKRINSDFEEIKIGYESLYNELNILQRVTGKIEENYKILDDIKKRELKSIEMIGIFTAVISFIIGTVGGFKYIDSFFSSIVFLIIYSVSLISFLIVLTIFTRGKKTLEENRINFVTFYCATVSILFFIFLFKQEIEKVGSLTKPEFPRIHKSQ